MATVKYMYRPGVVFTCTVSLELSVGMQQDVFLTGALTWFSNAYLWGACNAMVTVS